MRLVLSREGGLYCLVVWLLLVYKHSFMRDICGAVRSCASVLVSLLCSLASFAGILGRAARVHFTAVATSAVVLTTLCLDMEDVWEGMVNLRGHIQKL